MKKTILSISILAVMSFGSGIALANTTYGTTTSNATTTATDNGEQITCSAIGCPVTTIEGLNQLKNLAKQEGQKAYQLKASYSAEVKKEILAKNEKLVQAKKEYKDTILELNNVTSSKVAELSEAFTKDLSELNQVLAEVQKKGSKYLRTTEGKAELSEILGQIKELKIKFSSDIREAKNIKPQLEEAKNTYTASIEKAESEYKQAVSKIDDVYKPQMEKNASDIAKYNEAIKTSNQLIAAKRAVEQKEASELNALISELIKQSTENYNIGITNINKKKNEEMDSLSKYAEEMNVRIKKEKEMRIKSDTEDFQAKKDATSGEILKLTKEKELTIGQINSIRDNELKRYYLVAEGIASQKFPNRGQEYSTYLQDLLSKHQTEVNNNRTQELNNVEKYFSEKMNFLENQLKEIEKGYASRIQSANDIEGRDLNELNQEINSRKQDINNFINNELSRLKQDYVNAVELIKKDPKNATAFGASSTTSK